MKQTQTKLFKFSDEGLDFTPGSKNLFMDRFKKILALGYNTKTVTSSSVSGNQVTLNYSVAHKYNAGQVIKVLSGSLTEINVGEFVIDSVTTNSIVLTIDSPPTISGTFNTLVAPLGWSLVYELNNIHIYSFKHINESTLYFRICFQTSTSHRNAIVVAVGTSVDLALGTLTDTNVPGNHGTVSNSNDANPNMRWDFTDLANSTYNNYTYSQGESIFGNGHVVGSKYHLAFLINCYRPSAPSATTLEGPRCVFALMPTHCFNYPQLNYPVIIGGAVSGTSGGKPSTQSGSEFMAYVGNYRVAIDIVRNSSSLELYYPQASDSIFPPTLDGFNTTASRPIQLYEYQTKQFLGVIYSGLQTLCIGTTNSPPLVDMSTSPILTSDIDNNSPVLIHGMGNLWVAVPIEEIKIAN